MSSALRSSFALLALLVAPAAAAQIPQAIDDTIDAVTPKVVEWRRDIHQHPELSNREVRTAALVASAGA